MKSQGDAKTQTFLSYAREDEAKVKKLYQKLSKVGYKPWMDKMDLLAGEKWESAILKAIQESHFFIVCLSTNSVDKRGFLQREINEALNISKGMLNSDIYLIIARLAGC